MSRPVTALLGLMILAAHAGLVLRQFPPSSVARGGLPVKGDVARYIATAEASERLGGSGFDPMAMAGYPAGGWNSIGKKGYEILGFLTPGVPLGLRFYAYLVGGAILFPILYWATAWKLTGVHPLVAAAVVFVVWHLDAQVAYFWEFGNVLYPGTAVLVPLVMWLGWRVAGRGGWASAAALGLLLGWMAYAHTAIGVAVAVPLAVLGVGVGIRDKSVRPLVRMAASGAIAAALFAPWFAYLWATKSDVVPQPHAWFQAGVPHFLSDVLSDRAYRRPFDRNLILRFAVVAGSVGAYLGFRGGRPAVAVVGATGVWCLVVAYTFSFVPQLRSVQPYRFLVPAVACLAIPAMLGVVAAYRAVRAAPPSARWAVAGGMVVFAPSATGYLVDLRQPPLPCGLTADERALLDTLRDLPPAGRLICQPETVGHLVPQWAGKPVLGGLNDQAFVRQRFAGMTEAGDLFGKRAPDWTRTALARVIEDYAVGYAVFSSPDWWAVADAAPQLFQLVKDGGGWRVYRTAGGGYVLRGDGAADVRGDRVVCVVRGGEIVVKLHYSPRLRAANAELFPVPVGGDPTPFLGVRATPGSEVEIRCR